MNLVEIIYLLAVVFAFASVLVIHHQIAKVYPFLVSCLSGYLLILGLSNLMLLMVQTGWMAYTPYLFKIFMPLSLLAPVMLYAYVKGSLGGSYLPRGLQYLHLMPFVLVLIHYFPLFLLSLEEKQTLVDSVLQNSDQIVLKEYGCLFTEAQIFIFRTIQSIVYLIFTWRLLYRFEIQSHHLLLNKRSAHLFKWLKFVVKGVSVYQLALIVSYALIAAEMMGNNIHNIIQEGVFTLTALLLFILCSYLLLNPKILLSLDRPIELHKNDSNPLNIQQIIGLIKEKNWQCDPELSLPILLEKLGLKQREFTVALKNSPYEHFNDFINQLRLECFIQRATEKELSKNTIEGIASSCGFKSSSTFYRVFKEQYGMSPKQFIAHWNRANVGGAS